MTALVADSKPYLPAPSLRAALAFPLILGLTLRNGLPLHVAGCICPTTNERLDVVDHITLTRPFGCATRWTRVLLFEGHFGGLTALDACIRVREGQRQGENKNLGKFHFLSVRVERVQWAQAQLFLQRLPLL